ncbi:MAG: DUF523 domain-containing protein [Deltaproteobacteria bacterium]|nr:DUF523 domain-containing protein [Deltaproteobacteria bacterium]
MNKVLVSACLIGENVRYNGRVKINENGRLGDWKRQGRLVAFCPEVAGGLPVPRPCSEISGHDGRTVLNAVLKDGSPSCGSTYIYDGSFSGIKKPGKGITTVLLEEHSIRVFSEREIPEAVNYLKTLDLGLSTK